MVIFALLAVFIHLVRAWYPEVHWPFRVRSPIGEMLLAFAWFLVALSYFLVAIHDYSRMVNIALIRFSFAMLILNYIGYHIYVFMYIGTRLWNRLRR